MSTTEKIDHSERAHAEFSPSSLKYVAACPGYNGKEGTSDAAEMGTRIHEALEANDPSALHDEFEVGLYEEICAMEDEFLAMAIPQEHLAGRTEFNEIRMQIDLNGTCTFGTCDRLTLFGEDGSIGVMADYKTGISRIDPPDKNYQAMAYVVGAFQAYPDLRQLTFVFYIPQRNETPFHIFHRDRDYDRLVTELSHVIRAGEIVRPMWENGTPPLHCMNPSQYCRFCRFEESCPALGALATEVHEGKYSDPTDSAEELEEQFHIAKIVKSWAEAKIKECTDRAKDGMEFPNLRLVSMGKVTQCDDMDSLLKVAEQFDVTAEDLVREAGIALGKATSVVGSRAPKGKKQAHSSAFRLALEDLGVLSEGAERFTLK